MKGFKEGYMHTLLTLTYSYFLIVHSFEKEKFWIKCTDVLDDRKP